VLRLRAVVCLLVGWWLVFLVLAGRWGRLVLLALRGLVTATRAIRATRVILVFRAGTVLMAVTAAMALQAGMALTAAPARMAVTV
jgi:hypothetical protein